MAPRIAKNRLLLALQATYPGVWFFKKGSGYVWSVNKYNNSKSVYRWSSVQAVDRIKEDRRSDDKEMPTLFWM